MCMDISSKLAALMAEKRLSQYELARNRVSVIGKDGRFKIASTDIEYKPASGPYSYDYAPMAKVMGTGWKKVEAEIRAYHAAVAACIAKPPATPGGDDW